jgi:hypothetical protein
MIPALINIGVSIYNGYKLANADPVSPVELKTFRLCYLGQVIALLLAPISALSGTNSFGLIHQTTGILLIFGAVANMVLRHYTIRSFRWLQVAIWSAYCGGYVFVVFPPATKSFGGMNGKNEVLSFALGIVGWILAVLFLPVLYLTVLPQRSASQVLHLIIVFVNASVFAILFTAHECDAILLNGEYVDRKANAIAYGYVTLSTSGLAIFRYVLCYAVASLRSGCGTYQQQMKARSAAKAERSRRSTVTSPSRKNSNSSMKSPSSSSVVDINHGGGGGRSPAGRSLSSGSVVDINAISSFDWGSDGSHSSVSSIDFGENDSNTGESNDPADDDDNNAPIIKTLSTVPKEINDEFLAALSQLRNADTEMKVKLSLKRIHHMLKTNRELCTMEGKRLLIQVCSRRKYKSQNAGTHMEQIWSREVGELYGSCLREISVLKLLMRDIRGEAAQARGAGVSK